MLSLFFDNFIDVQFTTFFLALSDRLQGFCEEFWSTLLTVLDVLRHVGDDKSDDYLKTNDQMLDEDGKQDDIGSSPEGMLHHQIFDRGRLFSQIEIIHVLVHANLIVSWRSREDQDAEVDGDGKE